MDREVVLAIITKITVQKIMDSWVRFPPSMHETAGTFKVIKRYILILISLRMLLKIIFVTTLIFAGVKLQVEGRSDFCRSKRLVICIQH